MVKAGATLSENVLLFAGVAVLAGVSILLIRSRPAEISSMELDDVLVPLPRHGTRPN